VKCKICSREAIDRDYCQLHLKAYQNIKVTYQKWNKALSVNWPQYLEHIQKNSLTGEWAKEVVKHLIEEDNKNVWKNKEDI